jgi:hypothetical protein
MSQTSNASEYSSSKSGHAAQAPEKDLSVKPPPRDHRSDEHRAKLQRDAMKMRNFYDASTECKSPSSCPEEFNTPQPPLRNHRSDEHRTKLRREAIEIRKLYDDSTACKSPSSCPPEEFNTPQDNEGQQEGGQEWPMPEQPPKPLTKNRMKLRQEAADLRNFNFGTGAFE